MPPKVTEADIDAKSWQGNAGGFAGPGSTRELAKTAVAFFKSHPNWGQNPDTDNLKILNACVTGNWDVAETNIFGQVIQWRLPIHLAITNGKLEPKGIDRVYELSVLTQKDNPGQVKKAPPFDGYWVGNNWMMRLKKLPRLGQFNKRRCPLETNTTYTPGRRRDKPRGGAMIFLGRSRSII